MTAHASARSTLLVAAALLLAGVGVGGIALAVALPQVGNPPAAVAVADEASDVARSRGLAPPAQHPATDPNVTAVTATSDPAPPRRLRVPALGVDANVGDLGLTADGRLEVPASADVVGWWSGGSAPAAAGPTVLAAHVDWEGRPGVFKRLTDLAPGDAVVVVDADGSEHEYTVQRLEQHPKDAFPTHAVYGTTDDPTLRLITCGGPFDPGTGHYSDNVIVFARPTGRG